MALRSIKSGDSAVIPVSACPQIQLEITVNGETVINFPSSSIRQHIKNTKWSRKKEILAVEDLVQILDEADIYFSL